MSRTCRIALRMRIACVKAVKISDGRRAAHSRRENKPKASSKGGDVGSIKQMKI